MGQGEAGVEGRVQQGGRKCSLKSIISMTHDINRMVSQEQHRLMYQSVVSINELIGAGLSSVSWSALVVFILSSLTRLSMALNTKNSD